MLFELPELFELSDEREPPEEREELASLELLEVPELPELPELLELPWLATGDVEAPEDVCEVVVDDTVGGGAALNAPVT